jgi:hypothetical protein
MARESHRQPPEHDSDYDGAYDLGYNADGVRQVFALVDWMMRLRADLAERFRVELRSFEEQRRMPYVTSIERLAEARGRSSVVLALLAEVCGSVPEQEQMRVRSLSSDQLEQLAKALLRFQSCEDLEAWLNNHAAQSE